MNIVRVRVALAALGCCGLAACSLFGSLHHAAPAAPPPPQAPPAPSLPLPVATVTVRLVGLGAHTPETVYGIPLMDTCWLGISLEKLSPLTQVTVVDPLVLTVPRNCAAGRCTMK